LVDLLIKAIVDNYSYSFAQWQPQRIMLALKAIDENIAEKLDYSNSESLLGSIINITGEDLTEYLVKYNYPVWTDHYKENEFASSYSSRNNLLVITYYPPGIESFDKNIDAIHDYADKINADFVLLNDRKQGSLFLEKFRVKRFVAEYKRSIYVDYNYIIKEDCPDLFDIVPEGKVGVFDYSTLVDKDGPEYFQYTRKRMRMLKADAFSRFPVLAQEIMDPLEFECTAMDSWFDTGLIVCDNAHAKIWNPITFPFSQLENDDSRWIEISIYREGTEVFPLPSDYNYPILFNQKGNYSSNRNTKVFRYEGLPISDHIRYDWLDDNNIVGYKTKPPLANKDYIKILSLGHSKEQFDSIQDRPYLFKTNLNELDTKLGNSYSESRIYDIDFDKLFPESVVLAGLTTASWNKKYIGLNPIDELHNWKSLEYIDHESIICSSAEPCSTFISVIMSVLNLNYEQILSFIHMIGLENIERDGALSNQIIATRKIVKKLFDFYKEQAVHDKIEYFVNKHNVVATTDRFEKVKHGYLSELATLFWTANNEFLLVPQEVRRLDWYW
jgi:hypothetical protein